MTFCASGIAHKFLTARGLALGPPAGFGEMIVRGKLRAEKDGCKPGENAKENQRGRPGEKFLVGRRCDKRSPSLMLLETTRIVRTSRCFQSWLDGMDLS
jgi:hypothetical protein